MIKNRYIFRSKTTNQDSLIADYTNRNSDTASFFEIYAVESSESFTEFEINKLCTILNAASISDQIDTYSNSIIIVQRTAHLSPLSLIHI